MSVSETSDAIVVATRRALQFAGSVFGDFVGLYLESNHGVGLDIVARDPERFHSIISGLMGEKSCQLLEKVILEILEIESGVRLQESDFAEAIRTIKKRELAPQQRWP